MKNYRNFLLFSLLVAFFSFPASIVAKPIVERKESVRVKDVHFLVDGKPKKVANGKTFEVSYGEIVQLEYASMNYPGFKESSMNFIGFSNGSKQRPYDDRNYPIRLWEQSSKWASEKAESFTEYQVKVYFKSQVVGVVFFKLMHPQLEYMEMTLNGKQKVIRKKMEVQINADDKIKFGKVKLTPDLLVSEDIDIVFSSETRSNSQNSSERKKKKVFITLSHKGRKIGQVPVAVY